MQGHFANLMESGDDDFMSDWTLFETKLHMHFGSEDPIFEAKSAIDKLTMADNQQILAYDLEFNKHAPHSGINDGMLNHFYFKGLPEHLKDKIMRDSCPSTLAAIQQKVRCADQCYWERQAQKGKHPAPISGGKKNDSSTSTKNDSTTHTSSSTASTSKASSNTNHSNHQGGKKKNTSNNSKASSSTPAASSSSSTAQSSKPWVKHLGSDGKLNQAERQRRRDNNLCLYCGSSKHVAAECDRRSNKSKARAAQLAVAKSVSPPAAESTPKN